MTPATGKRSEKPMLQASTKRHRGAAGDGDLFTQRPASPSAPLTDEEKANRRRYIVRRILRDLSSLVVFLIVALTARASLADHYVVPTGSMIPTVHEGDRVVVSKAAYGLRVPLSSTWLFRWSDPARGDVVVLQSPTEDLILLKRVVAIPGDRVEVRGGKLILNGRAVESSDSEETLDGKRHGLSLAAGGGPDFGPEVVPRGKVLVIGDNRGNSRDGRSFGFVDVTTILGRALAVYSHEGSLVWDEI